MPVPATVQRRKSWRVTTPQSYRAVLPVPQRMPWNGLHPVVKTFDAGVCRTMRAAVKFATRFGTVSDDPATAVSARRGDRVNRTFEAIEGVCASALDDLKGLVVLVSANFAAGHLTLRH
jgi:hypothetical protein